LTELEGETECQEPIDSLYLDMNGIIHPCTHPSPNQGVPIPKTFEDMMDNIAKYIDLIMNKIKPR
jgi:5'-3' exoribonuclease 2